MYGLPDADLADDRSAGAVSFRFSARERRMPRAAEPLKTEAAAYNSSGLAQDDA
jgi:hypothetical protein